MDHNFINRQKARQERLERRRRAAIRRRARIFTTIFTVAILFITVVSANSIIANAGQGYEKSYEKLYTGVIVEHGETVSDIGAEHLSPGYELDELINEIGFINSLDDAYTIKAGTMLMVPYYAEVTVQP